MKPESLTLKTFQFLIKEWLLTATAAGLIFTSFHLKRLPLYSRHDFEVLFILTTFFVLIKGLERHQFFQFLASSLSRGRAPALKLILGIFFLSMFITNDVALLLGVPLALSLRFKRQELLVIFLALAANAGSALTPFGNPQNIFIYWFYKLTPWIFLKTIAPLSLITGLFLSFLAFFYFRKGASETILPSRPTSKAWFYLGALLIFILVLLKFLPFWVSFLVFGLAVFIDPRVLRIDYLLLLTFLFFFGFTDNLMAMLDFRFEEPKIVFWGSALASQFISNVPAALLFSDFTSHWKALLWGVNVGGFGSLIGSLANLIAYRFYLQNGRNEKRFLVLFHFWGYLFFALGATLYFLFQ